MQTETVTQDEHMRERLTELMALLARQPDDLSVSRYDGNSDDPVRSFRIGSRRTDEARSIVAELLQEVSGE